MVKKHDPKRFSGRQRQQSLLALLKLIAQLIACCMIGGFGLRKEIDGELINTVLPQDTRFHPTLRYL